MAAVQVPLPTPASAPPAPAEKPIGFLLIDCLPVGPRISNADQEVFAPCREAIRNAHNVVDYRMIDYGKGSGLFAAAVDAWLSKSGSSWPYLYVDSRSSDAMHVLPILTQYASVVIRGTG
jgi:hypothetical protein